MQIFKIDEKFEIVCEAAKTRNGFKHTATLLRNGRELAKAKVNYLNRTWESYEFETVLSKVVQQAVKLRVISDDERHEMSEFIRNGKQDMSEFKRIAAIAQMGEILAKNQKEKNDWKTRMLKAGLEGRGLIMPNDWDELDEATKEVRLNRAIEQILPPKGK